MGLIVHWLVGKIIIMETENKTTETQTEQVENSNQFIKKQKEEPTLKVTFGDLLKKRLAQ